ncbi:hypothetical protein [Rhizobium sp. KDH_Rht_773_N]
MAKVERTSIEHDTSMSDHLQVASGFATMMDASLEAASYASGLVSGTQNVNRTAGELRQLVSSYFAGHEYLNRLPAGSITHENENALVEQHIEVHVRKLMSWAAPADDAASALAALRLVDHDMDAFAGNPLARAMFTAAKAFYEQQENASNIPQSSPDIPLSALIATHQKAHSEFLAAIDDREIAEQQFQKAFEGKLYKGPFSTSYEMTYGMDWVQEQVSTEVSWHRQQCKVLEQIDPRAHYVALDALNCAEKNHLAAIADAFAEEKAKMDLAEARYDQLGDAEIEALLAIIERPCLTMEDVRMKGEYLSSSHLRGAFADSYYVQALIESMKATALAA